MTVLAVVAAAAVAAGVMLVASALWPWVPARRRVWGRLRRGRLSPAARRRVLLVVASGAAGWVITGIPLMAVITPAIVIGLPRLLARPVDAAHSHKLEGLESWSRTLSALVTTGAPLDVAIGRSISSTPQALRPMVERLHARLVARQPMRQAAYLFAQEVQDPLADMVAATMIIGWENAAGGVDAALEGLSVTMSEQVELRRQVDAEAAEPRMVATFMTVLVTVLGVFGLTNPTIAQAYSTAQGQVVLAVLVVVFVALLVVMRRLSIIPTGVRLFDQAASTSPGGGV